MCLLIALFGVEDGRPLVVGANRDERYDRPAVASTVLRSVNPRILGGRDELAGGTWLAVNEYGVVAGLTNRPSPGGRDPSKRTRGELPLAFAEHRDAATAVESVCARLDPGQYNPCWLLVGDRRSLYYVDMNDDARPTVEELGPGTYVLENSPMGTATAKSRHVTELLELGHRNAAACETWSTDEKVIVLLSSVLRDHTAPAAVARSEPGTASCEPKVPVRPPELSAACVHSDGYGTRSSMLVVVPADPQRPPDVLVADGPPCDNRFVGAALWTPGRSADDEGSDGPVVTDPH